MCIYIHIYTYIYKYIYIWEIDSCIALESLCSLFLELTPAVIRVVTASGSMMGNC